MKTIHFKFRVDETLRQVIDEDSRICSSMKRFAINRFQDGVIKTQINELLKSLFDSNSILRSSSIRSASGFLQSIKNKSKIRFGKFNQFQRGLITKEEYKNSRNIGIFCEGEANQSGNRLFKLDYTNNKIIYKRSRNEHYDLIIDQKVSDKQRWLLNRIQLLMEEKKTPITVRVKNDTIYLTYDEKIVEKEKQFKNLFDNRVLGIDLNPNYFGISIIEFNKNDEYKVIHKEVIDLNELQQQSKNKIHFELYQINHHILKLCKYWHVSKLAVEDLKFKKNNKFWSKDLNRLCRNQFRYSMVKNHLNILCSTYGVELIEVNAAYSSIIGNFVHGSETCPDMVAASIEIARRSYHKFKKGWYQPPFVKKERLKQVLGNQWKEELGLGYQSWKTLATEIKESKLKYRFPLIGSNAVLRTPHIKSFTVLYKLV